MKFIWDYKVLFEKENIHISQEEIKQVIKNIDSIWAALFQKYVKSINNN